MRLKLVSPLAPGDSDGEDHRTNQQQAAKERRTRRIVRVADEDASTAESHPHGNQTDDRDGFFHRTQCTPTA